MTQRKIDRILKKAKQLPFALRHWIFCDFIKDLNTKQLNYYIVQIKLEQRKRKETKK